MSALIVVTLSVWSSVTAEVSRGVLTVAFLDVGQGDAIYIESPNGHQVLIDGGKGRAVLRALGTVMSGRDRTIDVVLATHPDMDHIGGLPEVFERYLVGMSIEPGVRDDGADYQAFQSAIEQEGLTVIYARAGSSLDLGSGAYLTFLFPEGDVENLEPNTGSIVARLTYGNTSFLFTGDSPESIERYLVKVYGSGLASTVLKLGHHGSRSASSHEFLTAVAPETAIVSAGCDNQYGHPSTEVLDRLSDLHIPMYSTCKNGSIVFTSDGVSLVRKNM